MATNTDTEEFFELHSKMTTTTNLILLSVPVCMVATMSASIAGKAGLATGLFVAWAAILVCLAARGIRTGRRMIRAEKLLGN